MYRLIWPVLGRSKASVFSVLERSKYNIYVSVLKTDKLNLVIKSAAVGQFSVE